MAPLQVKAFERDSSSVWWCGASSMRVLSTCGNVLPHWIGALVPAFASFAILEQRASL